MRTKKVGVFMLCLLFASISSGISAQTHLDALIKKCETAKSVDMEVLKSRQKANEDADIKSVSIRITNDKKLVNDFLDAFKQDASNAEQVMFKKKNEKNEINYYQCQFPKKTYTIVVKEEGNASVTVGSHYLQSMKYSSKQREKLQKERMEQHKKKMEQHKELLKEREKQHKKRMEQHKERMKQHKEWWKQNQLKGLDTVLIRQQIIADSLILQSAIHRFNTINWDSIASKFGKDIDSALIKLDLKWDDVLEKYKFDE